MSHFWFIFSIFEAKKFFPENLALSRTTSYRFLAPCQNLERMEVQKDGRTEGWKDGQTLFYRTLPATTWGPKPDINPCKR